VATAYIALQFLYFGSFLWLATWETAAQRDTMHSRTIFQDDGFETHSKDHEYSYLHGKRHLDAQSSGRLEASARGASPYRGSCVVALIQPGMQVESIQEWYVFYICAHHVISSHPAGTRGKL